MVHVKRSVGYVQIALGIMLIFACFVAQDFLFDQIEKQYNDVGKIYGMITKTHNITLTPKEKLDNVQLTLLSGINTRTTIQGLIIIIFLLAIMMTLQGVANTRTGTEDDLTPKDLGRFVISLFLILYVIAVGYILLFKSSPHERVVDGFGFLIILAAFVGIIYLIRHFIKKIKHTPPSK